MSFAKKKAGGRIKPQETPKGALKRRDFSQKSRVAAAKVRPTCRHERASRALAITGDTSLLEREEVSRDTERKIVAPAMKGL